MIDPAERRRVWCQEQAAGCAAKSIDQGRRPAAAGSDLGGGTPSRSGSWKQSLWPPRDALFVLWRPGKSA